MSRALGDSSLHPFISCVPEVETSTIDDEDEFILMASDGLWDVMENADTNDTGATGLPNPTTSTGASRIGDKELIALIRTCSSPSQAARKVCALAYDRGSKDNISVVVVFLSFHFMEMSAEADDSATSNVEIFSGGSVNDGEVNHIHANPTRSTSNIDPISTLERFSPAPHTPQPISMANEFASEMMALLETAFPFRQ